MKLSICCVSDLIVQAKSGTGKTCVFCTIALDSLVLENPATQVSRFSPFQYRDNELEHGGMCLFCSSNLISACTIEVVIKHKSCK